MSTLCSEFPYVLLSTGELPPDSNPLCWFVGSPRSANVVCIYETKQARIRKIFKVDVRDGSPHFWVHQWTEATPEVIETFKVVM